MSIPSFLPDHLTCLLRNLYAGQEAIVSTGHGKTDWFQTRRGELQGIYCHPAYLIYIQSISCEMLSWMKHKLELVMDRETWRVAVHEVVKSRTWLSDGTEHVVI